YQSIGLSVRFFLISWSAGLHTPFFAEFILSGKKPDFMAFPQIYYLRFAIYDELRTTSVDAAPDDAKAGSSTLGTPLCD
ncbi:MAG: hypothetical protein ACFFCW_23020, partial [Candidatus Hodarchaeota archaeon]